MRKKTAALAAALVALVLCARAGAQVTFGPAGPARAKTLAERGVGLNASYFGEFAANTGGGAGRGAAYSDQAAVGGNLDLYALAGLRGGALRAEVTRRYGRSLGHAVINNSVAVQQIYGGGQTYYLTTLTYEQKLFGGALDITAGRTELDQVALQDPVYCHFQSNAFCGQPDIMGKLINASFWPAPVWGGWARVAPGGHAYVSAGVFDTPSKRELGRHGLDLSPEGSRGVQIPLEAGYQTTPAEDPHPRRYDAGVVLDRTPFTHPVYNGAAGKLDQAAAYGRAMIYFQGRQLVYRPDGSAARGLTVFGALVFGPDGAQQADYNITAGALYQGPFASRPDDSFGAAIGETHYRRRFLDQLHAYRLGALGGAGRPYASLIMAELDYNARLTPWLEMMPNFQYIVHPDGLGAGPYPKRNLKDAFVAGFQFNIDLAVLAGL